MINRQCALVAHITIQIHIYSHLKLGIIGKSYCKIPQGWVRNLLHLPPSCTVLCGNCRFNSESFKQNRGELTLMTINIS